ncbi:molybdopterin molybdotransferase MoeA, partial [Georgenia sp. 10Sc9-8]|nr:molybdopterin molybdotransferase MoeA [Georgenia halotolerans]
MITVEEHLASVLAPVSALAPVRAPLATAHGCRLAEELHARLAVPPFDNSAMDGYAVRAADVAAATPDSPVGLRVTVDLAAGTGRRHHLVPGTAARIMTGAPVPPGADAVVPVEQTDQPPGDAPLPETVRVYRAPTTGAHLRRAGEDVRAGDELLPAGTVLGSVQLSAAASVGHGDLLVHPRPRVGVLSTGDELVPAGQELAHGQIPDSNSPMLAALVREAGGEPVQLGSVGDDPAE